jgi:hypothetical protein
MNVCVMCGSYSANIRRIVIYMTGFCDNMCVCHRACAPFTLLADNFVTTVTRDCVY